VHGKLIDAADTLEPFDGGGLVDSFMPLTE